MDLIIKTKNNQKKIGKITMNSKISQDSTMKKQISQMNIEEVIDLEEVAKDHIEEVEKIKEKEKTMYTMKERKAK